MKTLLAHYLNVIDLLTHDNVVMLRGAVDVAEGYLGQVEYIDADLPETDANEEAAE